jgi:hypothetical protein
MDNANLARGFFSLPDGPPVEPPTGEDVTIMVDTGDGATTVLESSSSATITATDDGGVIVDLNPFAMSEAKSSENFDDNLVEYISSGEVDHICADLLAAIESDDQSRQAWLENRAKGIEMLGFKLEEPRSDIGASSSPVEGMSSVRHPLLAEAVVRFQSNAAAELLPAEGPVKVRDDQAVPPESATASSPLGADGQASASIPRPELAEALEKDLNHYLLVTDRGYRSDTDQMLFWVGFGGCAFKKVYHDPIRRMPISRSIDAKDIIVSNAANDIDDCGRLTHVVHMRESTFVRMQIAGIYRKTPGFAQPQEQPNPVQEKIAEVQGLAARPQRPEDNEHTIYECYCELDISGFEHKDKKGDITGLQLPYRVSIDKDSRQILEIRRNWNEDDPNCLAKKYFVKFPFIPFAGFYQIGLLQLLGNSTRALTAAWRIALDAGMFSSFPGFLYSEQVARQNTNEFRIPPGGGMKIVTGGKPISDVVMPIPYKDMSQGLALMGKAIEEAAQRLGGTAELQVAEGHQDAPVGTTLAMIEQATKMLAAVHVRLHAAQSEEFQLLRERFLEDPESFWRQNRRPAHPWEVDEFLQALTDYDLVPAADPNTPSHMHRIMKAVAIKQLQAAAPQLYDAKAVDSRIMRMIGVDPYGLFAPPPPPGAQPPPDPKMVELMMKMQEQEQQRQQDQQEMQQDANAAAAEQEARQRELGTESADRAADRQSRERVAMTRDHTERMRAVAELVRDNILPPQVLMYVLGMPPAAGGNAALPPAALPHAAAHMAQPPAQPMSNRVW